MLLLGQPLWESRIPSAPSPSHCQPFIPLHRAGISSSCSPSQPCRAAVTMGRAPCAAPGVWGPPAPRSPGLAAAAPHSPLEIITLSSSILHGIAGEVGASIPPAAGLLASFITCRDSPSCHFKVTRGPGLPSLAQRLHCQHQAEPRGQVLLSTARGSKPYSGLLTPWPLQNFNHFCAFCQGFWKSQKEKLGAKPASSCQHRTPRDPRFTSVACPGCVKPPCSPPSGVTATLVV